MKLRILIAVLVDATIVAIIETLRIPLFTLGDKFNLADAWSTEQWHHNLNFVIQFGSWGLPLLIVPTVLVLVTERIFPTYSRIFIFILSEVFAILSVLVGGTLWIVTTQYYKELSPSVASSGESSATLYLVFIVNSLIVTFITSFISWTRNPS